MVAGDRDLPVPGPISRWFTDLFNDWGPGRPAGGDEDPRAGPGGRPDPAGAPTAEGAVDRRSGILAADERHRAVGQSQGSIERGSTTSPTTRSTAGPPSSCATSSCGGGSSRSSTISDRRRKLSEAEFERVFAFGGGAPRRSGGMRAGHLVVPTISLWALVPGVRGLVADSRGRLIEYLVANFDELVYV